MPVSMTRDGARYYLIYDQVGTLRAVMDQGGSPVKLLEYDSFGNVVSDSAPEFAIPFGFAGGFADKDTGLTRFGHRDYDPDAGRWTAKTPSPTDVKHFRRPIYSGFTGKRPRLALFFLDFHSVGPSAIFGSFQGFVPEISVSLRHAGFFVRQEFLQGIEADGLRQS